MNTYGGLEVELHFRIFLTPVLDKVEWSSPRPRRLNPGKRNPGTQTIRGWVGPRYVLIAVEKPYKFLSPTIL